MAKLVLTFNGNFVKDFELDKETFTIGRKPGNDIFIDNLAVSSTHAKILTILKDSFIEDLDSTNGTFLDGKKIDKHALKNGDIIVIGQHEIKYETENTGSGEIDFEQTMIIQPDAEGIPETEQGNSDNASSDGRNDPGPAKLQLMSGTNAGKELKLTKILTTLGRPGVQVAAITRRPKGYFLIVVDAGKESKMPLINDEEISKQQLLNDGDVIEVAGIKMGFFLL